MRTHSSSSLMERSSVFNISLIENPKSIMIKISTMIKNNLLTKCVGARAINKEFLNTHMPTKNKKNFGVIVYIYEYMLELEECKFARNGLTN